MSCSDIPEYNFSIVKGDDVLQEFRHLSGGEPADLTGFVIQLECALPELSQDAILGIKLGEYSFSFEGTVTKDLVGNRVKYEVVYYPEGLPTPKQTKFCGSISLIKEKVG